MNGERRRILPRTIRISAVCLVKEKDDLSRFRAMVLFSNSRNKGFFPRRIAVVFGGKRRVDEKDSAKSSSANPCFDNQRHLCDVETL